MLILDREPDVDLDGREVVRGVRLQVRPNGPVVDLPCGRITIGSSPRCIVRIQQPGVQPLHCLIIHDAQGLSVRRWAGETALNGQRLEESTLGLGDCLQIGPVELEIIRSQQKMPSTEQVSAGVPVTDMGDRARAGRDLARARSRKLLAMLRRDRAIQRELDQRVAELQQQIDEAAAERERTTSEFQRAMSDERERLIDENSQLREQVSQLTDQYALYSADRDDQISRQTAQLQAKLHELAEEKTALLDERSELVSECDRLRLETSRLTDLERKIADAEAAHVSEASTAAKPPLEPTRALWGNSALSSTAHTDDPAPPSDNAADLDPGFSSPMAEAQGAYGWLSPRDESSTVNASQYETDADPFGAPATPGFSAHESPWGGPAVTGDWSAAIEGDRDTNRVADQWEKPSRPVDAAAEVTSPWQSQEPFDSQAAASSGQPSDDVCSALSSGEPTAMPKESTSVAVESTATPPQTSFIERYSHMFANDDTANGTPPATDGGQPHADQSSSRKPRAMGAVDSGASATPFSGDEEEESIEQYMAKLLQRVRGDTQGVQASQLHPSRLHPMTGPVGDDAASLQAPSALTTLPLALRDSASLGGGELESFTMFDASRRRSSATAQPTDLEALRALANESARRAISRHALRKHRRNALTKVIVSTLAGVTSLWLMLQSPDWRDLQFITACLAMLVAAYWAGETFRTLLESFRVAAHDDPEDEAQELSSQFRSPLPIDVENAHTWAEKDYGAKS